MRTIPRDEPALRTPESLRRLGARARAAFHLARAVVTNRLGRVTYPSLAHLAVTWRCNLRCQTCNVWHEDLYPELDTDGMLRMLAQLPFLDIIKVTGGEPFLRDDMVELVSFMQKRINPMLLQVICNGTLPDRMVDFVQRVGNRSLYLRISLEGTGETHSRLRGRKWAFDKTWKAITSLAPLRKKHHFHLGINYHICEETLQDLPELLKYCHAEGIDVVPGLAVFPFMEDKFAEGTHTHFVTDRARFLEEYRRVYRLEAGYTRWEAAWLKRQGIRVTEELMAGSKDLRFGCRELRNLIWILPNGNLITCGLKHRPIGNLANSRFEDIWFGEKIQEFREDVDRCSGCLQASVKISSRLYNGQIFRT